MKTTARILTGLIPIALTLCVVASSLGQSSAYRPEEARRRCDDLLQRSRQAMAENNLSAAETLIAQAEALGVDYGTFYRGDTPEKARRDLQRKIKAAGSASSGQLLSPLGLGKKPAPVTDPFAARNGGSTAAGPDAKSAAKSHLLKGRQELAKGNLSAAAYWHHQAAALPATFSENEDSPAKLAADIRRQGGQLDAEPAALPAAGAVTPLPPVAQAPPLGSGATGYAARAESNRLLLDARRALAEGDVRRATGILEQATTLPVHYEPTEDSPAKVEATVQSYSDLMAQKAQRSGTEAFRTQYARILMEQAEALLQYGDYEKAEHLATMAARQGVNFGPYQPNPADLLRRIAAARREGRISLSGINAPGGVVPATGSVDINAPATRAIYDQANDRTRNVPAGMQQPPMTDFAGPGMPVPAPPVPSIDMGAGGAAPAANTGQTLFQQGEAALMAHDTARALDFFRQAHAYRNQLDPATAQRLQDRLQMLASAPAGPPPDSMLDEAAQQQRRLFQQAAMDVARQESEAKAMRETDPKAALALLAETRRRVETAGLESAAQQRMLERIDRNIADTQQYLDENRARIELEEQGRLTREEIEQERQMKLDGQEKLARLTDEFNKLLDEQRYAEAEVVAKRAAEIDPENPLTVQLLTTARLIRHHFSNLDLRAQKEEGFWQQLANVEESSVGFNDNEPYQHGDVREWQALSRRRLDQLSERGRRRSERELEIEQKLKTPVMLEFENAPLSQVMNTLAQMAAVNLHLDPEGLAQEGIPTDDPVTISLSQEITLKSALNLILEPRHLGYVIKDEVLKITSEENRAGEIYQEVYNVADLVMPIPNFVPSSGMGLAGAYHDALGSVGFGGQGPFGTFGAPMPVVASRSNADATLNPTVLAQMQSGQGPMTGAGPASMPIGFGPGGMGGGAMADFDSLIELITTTVAPETWDDVGGAGSIAPFETNLSIVVSQTQDVHEDIVDLLEQLRRMQDLQVTIEVRFITLNDNFFERIGIDFDFDIDDDIDRPFQVFGRQVDDGDPDTGAEPLRNTLDVDHDRALTVGLQQPGVFSADLDIPFTQNSFGLAVPQFGGFDASAGAQMGFAILSDIEAFFFISAAQGDRRSNVMQAPKVTLFNGQQAYVSDTSQSPFVISVIPVVGDFAAAQQPVIVVLSEGTFLTVQAVVSDDRRFVRLTVVPFFSRIGDVETFQFEGSETTTENSSENSSSQSQQAVGDDGESSSTGSRGSSTSGRTVSRSGTTVQLPTFSFVTVTTTVSVPDGGTVLLGGIKRLSEGRNEFGVPMLNKLPYINRLFKNVGIGRETQSLMLMVTPRIIIQEEEEEMLGILAAP